MNNVVSRLKYIYSIYNPVIRNISTLLWNKYEHKIEIVIISTILLIVFLMYFIEYVENKYHKLNKSFNKENKLFLLTKFNTLLNKIMPIDIESFSRSTYLKILGDDFSKIYPRIFNRGNKSKIKKHNNRVSFDDNNINFMI